VVLWGENKMTYELTLKLKNAGFKSEHQMDMDTASFCVRCPYFEEYQPNYGGIEPNKGFIEMCYPTLSELIEACGDGFGKLQQESSMWRFRWYACDLVNEEGSLEKGSTPEEAVARLWLALNKK